MRRQSAFTLVELLVVIGIIALLVAILLPALGKARQQALLTVCQAQMKDVGNSILMYTIDNKGSFPGPILGQIRCGYKLDSQDLGTYIYRYLKLPPATTDWQPIKAMYCPGYRASNPGVHDESSEWTYVQQSWDPYPWFGYPAITDSAGNPIFPLRQARAGTIKGPNGTSLQIAPMKTTQVFNAQEMPLLSDFDNASVIYTSGVGVTNTDQYLAIAKVPNHGGRPELKQGISEFGSRPFYSYTDKTARTDPPRNWLFADGHVQTIRRSDPVLPPQLLSKYGPKPVPWLNPVLN